MHADLAALIRLLPRFHAKAIKYALARPFIRTAGRLSKGSTSIAPMVSIPASHPISHLVQQRPGVPVVGPGLSAQHGQLHSGGLLAVRAVQLRK